MDAAKIREAIAVLGSALAEAERTRVTWGRLWELYSADPPVKENTFKGYLALWEMALGEYFGEMDAGSTTKSDIAAFRVKRKGDKTKRGGRPIRPATRNREVMLLRTLSSWGTLHGHLQRNPLAGLRDKEPENNVRETVLSEPMLRMVTPWMPQIVTAFVVTVLDSGMRRNEASQLRWEQVNVDHGVIELSRRQTKGEKARLTMLSKRAATLLSNLPRFGIYVFHNPETDSHYTPDFFLKKWRHACECAGLQGPDGNITLHDLRRTFATRGRRAGIQESELMAMGGWSSAEVFTRYSVVGLDDVAEARRRAEAYLRSTNRRAAKKSPASSNEGLTTRGDSVFSSGATIDE
jgi:integrase